MDESGRRITGFSDESFAFNQKTILYGDHDVACYLCRCVTSQGGDDEMEQGEHKGQGLVSTRESQVKGGENNKGNLWETQHISLVWNSSV